MPIHAISYTQAALFSWTKDELDVYEYWRMKETSDSYKLTEEYEKGIYQGIGIGEKKNRRETARKMRSKGFCTVDIIEVTGLRREEIEK